jgi:hypothetical protein
MARISGTLHKDHYIFLIISRLVLIRMRNVSDKNCSGNHNTHFVFNNFFFRKWCLYEIKWKTFVQRCRPQMAEWRIRFACWIHKTKNAHSQCIILTVFPLQQCLHKCLSMLRLCVHCQPGCQITIMQCVATQKMDSDKLMCFRTSMCF